MSVDGELLDIRNLSNSQLEQLLNDDINIGIDDIEVLDKKLFDMSSSVISDNDSFENDILYYDTSNNSDSNSGINSENSDDEHNMSLSDLQRISELKEMLQNAKDDILIDNTASNHIYMNERGLSDLDEEDL